MELDGVGGRRYGGDSHTLTGTVRLGATEGFGSFFLAPQLSHFCERHPSIEVELLIMPALYQPLAARGRSGREHRTSPGQRPSLQSADGLPLALVRQRAADLAEQPPIKHLHDVSAHRFFGDAGRFGVQPCAAVPARSPDAPCRCAAPAWWPSTTPCAKDGGWRCCPVSWPRESPDLVPVLVDEIDLVRTFWIAAPGDRRELARVRALWEFVREAVQCNQPLLMGESPQRQAIA